MCLSLLTSALSLPTNRYKLEALQITLVKEGSQE